MASSNTLPSTFQSPHSSPSLHPTPTMEKEYEFFVTTNEPHQPDGPERGLIRRLVMRNFFESKWSGPSNNSSEHNSASTVQAKTKLKSRFRLGKPGQETTDAKCKPRSRNPGDRGNKEEGEKVEKRPRVSRTLSTQSGLSYRSGKSGGSSRRASPAEDINSGMSKPRLLLKINPNAHRFDPFDVLPVPGTPELDTLFKLYKRGSRVNSIVINARHTWWSFISNDAGLLHATLATWALYGMLVQGLAQWEVQKLRHKNEAIKEVNNKIGSPSGKLSDELVGTVLTLASFENLLGAYDAAQLHIAALKRMVNARGGLFAFGHNDGLIRGIIWVDFHSATAFHTKPSFPRIRLDPDTPPLPDSLLEEAAYNSPSSPLQLSLAAVDCFNILYRLHRLAMAISAPWIRKVDRLTISNLLYETEYIILFVPDYSRDFLDFDLEPKEELDGEYEERARMADAASVVEALLAAAHIFIYAALREVPPKAKIFSILLDRMRVALNRPKIDVIDIWKKEKNLDILVWVLVIACSIAPAWGGRGWFISHLAEVLEELGVHSEIELERTMQRVAWTDVFFGQMLTEIWEDLCAYVAAAQRAEVCLTSATRFSENTIDPQLLGN